MYKVEYLYTIYKMIQVLWNIIAEYTSEYKFIELIDIDKID